jgi:hypothetical protein
MMMVNVVVRHGVSRIPILSAFFHAAGKSLRHERERAAPPK